LDGMMRSLWGERVDPVLATAPSPWDRLAATYMRRRAPSSTATGDAGMARAASAGGCLVYESAMGKVAMVRHVEAHLAGEGGPARSGRTAHG
jgi:hypothetical protein